MYIILKLANAIFLLGSLRLSLSDNASLTLRGSFVLLSPVFIKIVFVFK